MMRNIEEVQQVLAAAGLGNYFDKLSPLLRPKIELELSPAPEKEFKTGQSKIGGCPDLSDQTEWPKSETGKSLSFIAQINLSDLKNLFHTEFVSGIGLISFFYDADQESWGFDPKDVSRFKVIFTEEIASLKRHDFPHDLEEHARYKANRLSFHPCFSLPGWGEDSMEGLMEEKDFDKYWDAAGGSYNQMFGYANAIQGEMELECQLVTNGLYCGDASAYSDPRRTELEKNKSDWTLLLQIDSEDDKTGMMWGDCGRLYFWIRKQDLQKRDFSKTWCILQCS